MNPLSPYLFILCAEGLSAMLQSAENARKIEGIKICRGAPRVNHIFFADDSLMLMRAKKEDAHVLKHILEIYERALGQVINKDKSSIMFSPNTTDCIKGEMRKELSIVQEARSEKYLGLPISVGKSRKKAFEYIKQRIWAKIQGWQEKLLSKAGKEILIKAVAQASRPMRCPVNLAILARQAWRPLIEPDTLCGGFLTRDIPQLKYSTM